MHWPSVIVQRDDAIRADKPTLLDFRRILAARLNPGVPGLCRFVDELRQVFDIRRDDAGQIRAPVGLLQLNTRLTGAKPALNTAPHCRPYAGRYPTQPAAAFVGFGPECIALQRLHAFGTFGFTLPLLSFEAAYHVFNL